MQTANVISIHIAFVGLVGNIGASYFKRIESKFDCRIFLKLF